MDKDLHEYLKDQSQCEAMVFKMKDDGPDFLADFEQTRVLNLKGLTWNPRSRKIDAVKLEDVLWGQGPYAGAYRERTLCFVGREAEGKSTFIHALAREMCKRSRKDEYAYGGSIDPYGLLTRSGSMHKMGCFCFSDFELRSKLSERLSMEDVKQFLFVEERASIGARYHVAVFPEHVPRLWAINSGMVETDQRGEQVESNGHWFEKEDRMTGTCIALKHLAENDEEWLQEEASAHQRAQCRRIMIFDAKDLYDKKKASTTALVRKRLEKYAEDLENGTPRPKKNRIF